MHKRGKITLFYRDIATEEQNHGAGSNHAQESGASLNALLESIHRGQVAIMRALSMQNRNRGITSLVTKMFKILMKVQHHLKEGHRSQTKTGWLQGHSILPQMGS